MGVNTTNERGLRGLKLEPKDTPAQDASTRLTSLSTCELPPLKEIWTPLNLRSVSAPLRRLPRDSTDFVRSATEGMTESVEGFRTSKRRMQSPHDHPESRLVLPNLSSKATPEIIEKALIDAGVPTDA